MGAMIRLKITNQSSFAANDFRRNLPRFQKEAMQKNQQLLGCLQDVAGKYPCTLAQLALAWVMSKGDDIVPIPGARKLGHLRDNAAAANFLISEDDIKIIDNIFKPEHIHGLRYTQDDFDLIDK